MSAIGLEQAPGPVKLRCLGGEAAPPDLAAHLRRLRDLPEGARLEIWKAIDASLGETISPETEQVLDAFERAYVADLLAAHEGNVSRAAAAAGLDRNHLAKLAKKHGVR